MLKVDLIVVGRLRNGPYHELFEEYSKRLKWTLKTHELESRHTDAQAAQRDENDKILSFLKNDAFVIAMDERGNGLRSMDFAQTIQKLQNNGNNHLQFIIGGADGLLDETRGRANLLLSFGQQTWPHMLVRVMLIEQIYRAQQILSGHPYHRE
jgi:23S rRNA (pseudouridine1915-N3)-methyltransferase